MKHLGINLMNDVKECFQKTKTLVRKTEDDTSRWEIYHGLEEVILFW